MRKTRKYSEDVPFSLTSMMDMMTIILVFMIKNIDAEGQLVTQAENLVLPNSTSKVQPKEVSLTVVVDNGFVVVDNEKIVPTADVLAQDSLLVEKVNAVLEERRQIEKDHALANNLPADEAGRIIVQIDKNIPYDAMYKVMATCGFSGYTNIAFAVMMKNGGEE
ncbi:MAG: biopolymer transporter ExbD [Fibrobacter sp.]|uniref:biopolymer transporter ExbD n=1 Tax=uncultured Fibrobacter sp. TaxID=261512 RepID=UPI0025D196E5|nr:biopolymer transporter ExbD [uncultured Fibrobacter sp.]MBO4713286.1 biopolymer transporter ExbD [Fibrobacter sp.]